MKIYKIESNNVAYDEDESMVVIALSGNRALEIALKSWKFREGRNHRDFNVAEVDLNEEKIVEIAHYGE
jgi:hypothetical protein